MSLAESERAHNIQIMFTRPQMLAWQCTGLSEGNVGVYAGSKRMIKLKQVSYSGSYGRRCFARVAPKMWNLLPLSIRCQEDVGEFKKRLKTFLFTDFSEFEKKLKEV